VWESLTFILNGLVFVLIGLQFPAIRTSIRSYQLSTILTYGAVFSVLLILLRLASVFPGARLSYFLRTRIGHQQQQPPEARRIFVIGWTGMRGVVSLAAALALPTLLKDGPPFPHRDLIIPDLLRNFCDSGLAGPHPAASDSSAGPGQRGGSEL
jgi:monovalent cation/hydrogen antiporter